MPDSSRDQNTATPAVGKAFKHGTLYGYKRQKCRCDSCRKANADYSRRTTNHERHRAANRRWYANRKYEQASG